MDQFSRTVLGYHGCEPDFAEALLRGEISISEWKPSQNDWDWLGHGIYFWEYAPERAKDWGRGGAVVGAIIQTGQCLDLTDVPSTRRLAKQFDLVRANYEARGVALPENRGMRGDLDCMIINDLVASTSLLGRSLETIRCPFLEGEPAYPGSRIRQALHVQLVVRNHANILGIFRPNIKLDGGAS